MAAVLATFTLAPALQSRLSAGNDVAQLPSAADGRYAGLQWRFVRIKYHYDAAMLRARGDDIFGEPWGIDSPAAEQNLSRRMKTATAIQVEDPILLTLDDPRLFEYPWIYIVE